jgi:hypothetical protein
MQVPYNPIPTADAQARGAPNVNVATPGEAFGTTIGSALQGLGKSLEHGGDELYARAVALKNLQNETEAREADAKYMIEAGDLHAKFNALEGKDAVAAYPQYQKDLDNARLRHRDGLSTDMSKKMFDASALNTMSRSIFNGAGHAASQNKAWASGAINAQVDLWKNGTYNSPEDDVAFERTRRGVESAVDQKAGLHGWDDVQIKDVKAKEISDLWAHRITGLAKKDPIKAMEMLEANGDKLQAVTHEKVENVVRSQGRTVGARVISDTINKDLYDTDTAEKPEESLQSRINRGMALAKKQMPNDPIFPDIVRDRITADVSKHKAAIRDADENNRLAVESGIMGVNTPENKRPTSVEELTTDPKVADAWDKLKGSQKRTYERILASNAKGDFNETPERRDRYHTLLGMASSTPAEFLDVNVAGEEIPAKWRTELFKKQLGIKKGQEGDPRTGEAMRLLEPILRPLDINMQGSNKDRYFQYKGALGLALEDWRTQYGKSPSPKEVREIGARLLQKQHEPGWLWGSNETTTFELKLPDKVKEEVLADFKNRGMATPSDEEIRQAYVHKFYKQLQENGKQSPTGPQVPMSQ